ncbi:monovalent cation/H(+) antiporter subunit G [Halorubrum gandharaense]
MVLSSLTTPLVILFAAIGVFFTLVAAVGVIRLPDVYSRSHAATKADTLGAGFAILASAVYFGTLAEAFRAAVLVLFVYYTNPTAAHAISRAAYSQGIEVWTTDGDTGEDAREEAQ